MCSLQDSTTSSEAPTSTSHGQTRSYRPTPRRLLFLTVIFVIGKTLWYWLTTNETILMSSFLNRRPVLIARVPSLLPLSLPLPSLQLDAKYTLGKAVSGCAELLDQTPINTTRLEFFKNRSLASNREPVEQLKNLVKDCSALKRQHSYWRWPVTPQEQLFPLAFGFKMHDAPDMFERLLRVIWRPHNLYIIHVDRGSPDDIFQIIQDLARCFDNVLLTEKRINIVYTSVLSLYADIECVKMALESPVPWKYYLSASGHEFPLKTNLEIVQILTFLNGTNDVENYPPHSVFARFMKNASKVIRGQNTITSKRRIPFKHEEVVVRKGSAYFSANRKFLEWVLLHPVCQDFLVWLNETWAADEVFWATANYLPEAPGGRLVDIRHDKETFLSRAMTWQWDKYKCQGYYVRAVCIFGAKDLKWLQTRPELIANKFDNSKDPLVLDCLERGLEERADQGFVEMRSAASVGSGRFLRLSSLDWAYYEALPHTRGLSPV